MALREVTDGSFDGGGDARWQQNLVRPCLLLLLARRRSHGYDLLGQLRTLGLDVAERSVYRNLDALRRQGHIASDWETPSAGPARRVYDLTASGEDEMQRSAEELRRHVTQVTDLLGQLEQPDPRRGSAERRRWRAATGGRVPATRR